MIQIEEIKIERNKNLYKTNGLNKYNYPEIMINLPLDEKIINDIFSIFINLIGENKKLEEGRVKIKGLNCPVFIKKEIDYQIIFPDRFIRFPWDENCEELYKKQIKVC